MARKREENETAFDTLQEILRRDAERDGIPVSPKPKPEKMAVRVKAGRKGGKIGGKRRLGPHMPNSHLSNKPITTVIFSKYNWVIMVYRRLKDSLDLDWHFHTKCPSWPELGVIDVQLNSPGSDRICPQNA
jgi:hypothetical protein